VVHATLSGLSLSGSGQLPGIEQASDGLAVDDGFGVWLVQLLVPRLLTARLGARSVLTSRILYSTDIVAV